MVIEPVSYPNWDDESWQLLRALNLCREVIRV